MKTEKPQKRKIVREPTEADIQGTRELNARIHALQDKFNDFMEYLSNCERQLNESQPPRPEGPGLG